MRGKMALFSVLLLSGGIALMLISAPANAQGPYQTPTPLPVVATKQAEAAAKKKVADEQQAEADRLKAKLAEIERNAKAQSDAANQALSDANADAVSQNALAYGEDIGRAKEALSQLRDSFDGVLKLNAQQADIISAQYMTMTQIVEERDRIRNENQQLKSDKQTILANYNAVQTQLAEQQSHLTVDPIVAILAGAFLLIVIIVFIGWKWSRNGRDNRSSGETADEEIIDTEYKQSEPE